MVYSFDGLLAVGSIDHGWHQEDNDRAQNIARLWLSDEVAEHPSSTGRPKVP